MRKKKRLKDHFARMSIHIFLHAWSTHSHTLEIRIQHNVTPGSEHVGFASDYRYIDSFHARIQKVLSEGVQLCNTDNILGREKGSKYHEKQANIGPPEKRHLNGVMLACRLWPTIECWLHSFENFKNFRRSRPVLLRKPIFL